MHHFQGYLRSYATDGARLTVRLFAGTIDPDPEREPVYEIVIERPTSLDAAVEVLKQIEREDAWLYVNRSEGSALQIESENGAEYQLSGHQIHVRAQGYSSDEWQWLARRNHEHAQDLNKDLVKARTRINRSVELIAEQQSRLEAKARGHEVGTTARTLYEQHATFLRRLRAETEA